MPRLAACLFLWLGVSLTCLAQSSHITGTVSDTAEKRNLSNGSVLLLRPADSILVQHTRTDAAGRFTFKNITPGHYLFVVTYPSYADYPTDPNAKHTPTIPLPPTRLI